MRHRVSSLQGLRDYDGNQLAPEFRPLVHLSEEVIQAVEETLSPELTTVELTDDEIDALVSFLKALTSPSAREQAGEIPESVPSGLPIVAP